MALIFAAGSRNETQKLVAETVEGMREVKWPQNAGTVVSPLSPCVHAGASSEAGADAPMGVTPGIGRA